MKRLIGMLFVSVVLITTCGCDHRHRVVVERCDGGDYVADDGDYCQSADQVVYIDGVSGYYIGGVWQADGGRGHGYNRGHSDYRPQRTAHVSHGGGHMSPMSRNGGRRSGGGSSYTVSVNATATAATTSSGGASSGSASSSATVTVSRGGSRGGSSPARSSGGRSGGGGRSHR